MLLLNQKYRKPGEKVGFLVEEDNGIRKCGEIWVNFISRWKQCPPEDLRDDLRNNCALQWPGAVSKWGFYGSRVPHGPVSIQNHIKRKYISEAESSFQSTLVFPCIS